jgi:hypothetical protein
MAHFFAYGDRMNPERMAEFVPEARLVGPARLPGYRLAMNVSSRTWGGGAANAVPDAAASMWGVLWDLGEEDPTGFDSFRGDDETGHGLIDVTVEGPEGPVVARTLCITTGERYVRPTERYVAMLRANAERQGLPAEAIEQIEAAAEGLHGQTPSI